MVRHECHHQKKTYTRSRDLFQRSEEFGIQGQIINYSGNCDDGKREYYRASVRIEHGIFRLEIEKCSGTWVQSPPVNACWWHFGQGQSRERALKQSRPAIDYRNTREAAARSIHLSGRIGNCQCANPAGRCEIAVTPIDPDSGVDYVSRSPRELSTEIDRTA